VTPVETCRDCGGLFGYLPRGICADCQDVREERFQAVRDHLRDNGDASITQTSDATGVDEGLIVAFIRDGRLRYTGADAGRLDGIDHDEDVKARIRAQLAAQAGPAGTDPRAKDRQGPAAASSHLGMRSRT
jgi:hypothetical protein